MTKKGDGDMDAVVQALAQIQKASMVEDLVTITASAGRESWPVRIRVRADEYFEISGRSTRLELYLTRTNAGYLAAIPNFNRCGHVPEDCSAYDVMNYVGVDNRIDATTLAAAIRYLIEKGFVQEHPNVKRGENDGARSNGR